MDGDRQWDARPDANGEPAGDGNGGERRAATDGRNADAHQRGGRQRQHDRSDAGSGGVHVWTRRRRGRGEPGVDLHGDCDPRLRAVVQGRRDHGGSGECDVDGCGPPRAEVQDAGQCQRDGQCDLDGDRQRNARPDADGKPAGDGSGGERRAATDGRNANAHQRGGRQRQHDRSDTGSRGVYVWTRRRRGRGEPGVDLHGHCDSRLRAVVQGRRDHCGSGERAADGCGPPRAEVQDAGRCKRDGQCDVDRDRQRNARANADGEPARDGNGGGGERHAGADGRNADAHQRGGRQRQHDRSDAGSRGVYVRTRGRCGRGGPGVDLYGDRDSRLRAVVQGRWDYGGSGECDVDGCGPPRAEVQDAGQCQRDGQQCDVDRDRQRNARADADGKPFDHGNGRERRAATDGRNADAHQRGGRQRQHDRSDAGSGGVHVWTRRRRGRGEPDVDLHGDRDSRLRAVVQGRRDHGGSGECAADGCGPPRAEVQDADRCQRDGQCDVDGDRQWDARADANGKPFDHGNGGERRAATDGRNADAHQRGGRQRQHDRSDAGSGSVHIRTRRRRGRGEPGVDLHGDCDPRLRAAVQGRRDHGGSGERAADGCGPPRAEVQDGGRCKRDGQCDVDRDRQRNARANADGEPARDGNGGGG